MTKIEGSRGEILPPQPVSEVYKTGDYKPNYDKQGTGEGRQAGHEQIPVDRFEQSPSSPKLVELQQQLARLEELEDADHTDHTVKMQMRIVKELIQQELNELK